MHINDLCPPNIPQAIYDDLLPLVVTYNEVLDKTNHPDIVKAAYTKFINSINVKCEVVDSEDLVYWQLILTYFNSGRSK